jgi:hypothetical protein
MKPLFPEWSCHVDSIDPARHGPNATRQDHVGTEGKSSCFATEPLGKRDLLWEPDNIAAFRVKPHSWGIKNISEIFLLFASVSNRTKRIWRLFRYGNNKNMMVG